MIRSNSNNFKKFLYECKAPCNLRITAIYRLFKYDASSIYLMFKLYFIRLAAPNTTSQHIHPVQGSIIPLASFLHLCTLRMLFIIIHFRLCYMLHPSAISELIVSDLLNLFCADIKNRKLFCAL